MAISEAIDQRVQLFRADLKLLAVRDIVNKHVLTGTCCMLADDQYVELRGVVAEKFGLQTAEVIVVGSSKLGFSISPAKRYRHFGEESDIDVAIVSDRLFSEIWQDVHQFHENGGYWDIGPFRKYLFQGWIRPDKLPPVHTFAQAKEWWKFFKEVTQTNRFGPYKVKAGLYKSWYYLEAYQTKSVTACIEA
jgi:predicted nucleotidyltransferase